MDIVHAERTSNFLDSSGGQATVMERDPHEKPLNLNRCSAIVQGVDIVFESLWIKTHVISRSLPLTRSRKRVSTLKKSVKNMKRIPIGSRIMIPCATASGPFSDERRVSITVGGIDWFGFVNSDALAQRGDTWFIPGIVVGTKSGNLLVRLPGSSPTGNVVHAPRSNVTHDTREKRAS